MESSGNHSLTENRVGPYVLQRLLGRGGMGEVYLAHDEALDRAVAIKFMAHAAAGSGELVRRFLQEARAAARLNHPNIVQIHTVDAQADRPYMVMEYIDGLSVDRLITPSSPLPWQRALSICVQVAAALECAHAHGIIHRDVKPANIIVENSGRVRVTDFGIAKVLGVQTQLTTEKATVGSPCYMSPEQCGTGEVVPASDLFSLGITLHEMLTGRLPFVAETLVGYAHKIVTEQSPRLDAFVSDLPPFVQPFVDALLAKNLERRYATAAQVVEDLKALHVGEPPKHLPRLQGVPAIAQAPALPARENGGRSLVEDLLDAPSLPRRAPAPRQPGRSWWPIAVGGAAAAALMIAVVAWLADRGPNPAPGPSRQTGASPAAPEQAAPLHPPFPGQFRDPLRGNEMPNAQPPPPPHPSGQWPPPRRAGGQSGQQHPPGLRPNAVPGLPPPPPPHGAAPPPE